ncbi:MAG TPA: TetR/AcrR family transcriptional regulator [Candidatus Angelobacter sp.]|nr:TetR/AcrR family transcriptional regulator [Candidatus Angelobacter sp.]
MTTGEPVGLVHDDADVARRRAPGRPRDERADRAILDVTLELLAEVGPTALSVEEVASRAGVGKTTVYRRFPTKDELVVSALASLNASLPGSVPHGGVRDSLVEMVRSWWAQHEVSRNGQLFARVLAHAKSNPRMFCSFYDQVIEPRRELYRLVIRRGIEDGELRPDTDVELMTTLIISSSVYTLQVRASGRDAAPGAGPEDYVDAILSGFLVR